MATKDQFLNALSSYIQHDMLPKAEGNQKIILRSAMVAMAYKPDAVFNLIKNNSLIAMLDVIDEHDNIDAEMLAKMLSEGFGSDEFSFSFGFFGKEYTFHFSAGDIQAIKRYL